MKSKFLPNSDLSYIKSILLKINTNKLVSTFVLIIIGQTLYICLPAILGFLIDKITSKNILSVFWLMIFPLIWVISVIFSSLGKFYISKITQEVRKISKTIVFRHIIHLPSNLYIVKEAGEVENLMQELSFSSRYIFNENLPFFIRTLTTILVSILIIFHISYELSFLFLMWSLLYIPISFMSAKKSIKFVGESIASAAKVSASTVEVIQNHELIPAFGTEMYEISRFDQVLDNEQESFNKAQGRIDKFDFIQKSMQMILPFSLVIYIIYLGEGMQMSPGFLVSLFTLTIILTNQIGDFGKCLLSFLEMKERIKTALKKLRYPFQKQITSESPQTSEPTYWNIKFNNVSFSYDEGYPTIQNINLEIKQNEKIGIVGFSGAGKTTLFKLLRGFLAPKTGSVCIGGHCLSTINPKFLTHDMAEVSQNIPLFHRTIRENVAYGCDNIEDEEIWNILEKARIADYIKGLPNRLDTIVGVRGQKLSGGEKARLGIARAFIRKAKIILLDEATAAIDSESELLIQKGLEELIQNRTVIAISHRLSTLRSMDRIIVLDKGIIIAEGSHTELIRTDPVYKRLWNSQILV